MTRRLTASEMHMRLLALRKMAASNTRLKPSEVALMTGYADDLLADLNARVAAAKAKESADA